MGLEALEEPRHQEWHGMRWVVAAGCGSLKGGRSDWLVEKSCELGAFALQPLLTARSERMGAKRDKGEEGGGREARLERVALAATKQSLRAHGMEVRKSLGIAELAAAVEKAPVALLATAGAPGLFDVLRQQSQELTQHSGQECLLIIGPEGDFTDEELDCLKSAGALPVGLGENRLRTETAAIALLSAAAMFTEP
eukprot:CAMPEP_0117652930 /NCGR_PEP_ID=MMETSP0804-20121206/2910_1 /TAXON_ID=1074897 /ORGANISM="Tetraselmis astigmatica, Strain CCMP880" /LENGTH=195 /DNA_ID=CAMNT_0005459051 /DNA_START=663 /DNA_END=1250 /DNA_ORIENTATION=+